MGAISFVPPRVPICDTSTGEITREWFLFLRAIFERAGGSMGESTTDLQTSMFEDAGIEEAKSTLYALAQDTAQAPPVMADVDQSDDALLAIVCGLQDSVAELAKEIQALKQGATL